MSLDRSEQTVRTSVSSQSLLPVRSKWRLERRPCRGIVLILQFGFLVGSFGGVAHAADTVITFDEVAADTFLNTQFHDRGVDFGYPPYASLPETSQIPVVTCCTPITRAAPAGHASQVASISTARTEFWFSGMFGAFSTYRQRVQITVDNTVAVDTSPVTLSAFDINGALVGPPATAAVSGAGPPVTLTVTASGSTPTIAYFLVQSGDYNKGFWVDDLTFDNPSTPAPPDFAFDVQGLVWPGSALHVSQGGSLTKSLPIRRFNGSNGDITLSAFTFPLAVNTTFSPNPLGGMGTSVDLTLRAAANAGLAANAPILILGDPVGNSVGPARRSAQLLVTVDPPALIITDGANDTYERAPCTGLELFPIYVEKDPSVIQSEMTLALRVFLGATQTADLPAGLHASFNPPVSAQGSPVTIHRLTVSYDAGSLGSQPITLVVQGTSGPRTILSQPFTLKPVPNFIDSVVPPAGQIPNRLTGQPGTKVTITGQGFCPGSKVRFGNVLADADAESVTPTQIVASVPFLATDGSLSVIAPGGVQTGLRSPHTFHVDSVRNTDGFSFRNYVPHITFGQLTAAYGSDQTEDQIPLCWPFDCTVTVRDPNAIAWLNLLTSFTDKEGSGGACFGIALAAQRLIAGQRLRGDFPPPTASNNFALDAPGGASPPLTEYINSQVTVMISSENLTEYNVQSTAHSIGHTSDVLHDIHDRIRDALAAGEMPLIELVFSGDNLFQRNAHAVTAYDIEDLSNDPILYTINVYDPNLRFTEGENSESGVAHFENVTKSRIRVMADGTWTLLSGVPNRNFSGDVSELIVIRPSAIPSNFPTLPGSSLLSSVGGLTLFGTLNAGPEGSVPASRTTQLADNAGHTLLTTDGKLNKDPKTRLVATPFTPLAAAAGRGEVLLVAPKSGPIVQSVMGTRPGTDTHIVTSGGLTARVETHAEPSVADQIGFNPTGAISFVTKGARKPLTLGLMTHSDIGVQSAQIETKGSKGMSNELLFDKKRASVILRHSGPAAPLRLRLSTLAPKGGPVEFDSGPLQAGAGVTATFAPADWTRLATVAMTIRDSNGSEHQEILQNHLVTKALGHIVRLDIDRVPYQRRSRALDVFSRFEKISPDSEVIIIWIVRAKGHIIAHHIHILAAKDLHPGKKRRDRYVFAAPADGDYDVRTDLIVRSDEGVIPTMHTSIKSGTFRVRSDRDIERYGSTINAAHGA
jgi:hypothetical protein